MTDLSAQSLALSLGLSALVTVTCRKVKFPALLPLLAVGLALGPSSVGVIDGSSLGEALRGFVTVAIGLLIFEGALHLNREELSHAPRAVWGLLTVGALVTWTGAAAAAYWLLELPLSLAILLGAALIVTGPTVVQPVLRLVRVSPRLHAVLSAEAVLIDPIGVVAAVTALEIIRLTARIGPDLTMAGEGVWLFIKPIVGGAGVGLTLGLVGRYMLRRIDSRGKADPQFLNLFAVGLCMTCVGVGEAIASEAGLAAATVCGICVANVRVLGATELRSFKELLATILVGTLFVLLASRFDPSQLRSVGRREALFVAVLLFAVRPICVLVSSWKSKLSWPERVFASLFAPRGIVALSMIAIVAADLGGRPETSVPEGPASIAQAASRLEPIMFVVIVGTVLSATLLSPALARVLGVRAGRGNGILIIGAHPLSIALARALDSHGAAARLIDRNSSRAAGALQQGIDVLVGDATDTRWLDDAGARHDTGWVLAWTGNDDVDLVAGRWGEERFGAGHAAVWSDKPARGALARLDLDSDTPISAILDGLDTGHYKLADTTQPETLSRVLVWIDKGTVTLFTPGASVPPAGNGRRFLGLLDATAPLPGSNTPA